MLMLETVDTEYSMNDSVIRMSVRTPPPLSSSVANMLNELGDIASDHVELAILEAQHAAIRIPRMLAVVIAMAIIGASAWLALVASGVALALGAGMSAFAACAAAAVLNLLLAAVLWYWLVGHSGERLFSATLRQIRQSVNESRREASK